MSDETTKKLVSEKREQLSEIVTDSIIDHLKEINVELLYPNSSQERLYEWVSCNTRVL